MASIVEGDQGLAIPIVVVQGGRETGLQTITEADRGGGHRVHQGIQYRIQGHAQDPQVGAVSAIVAQSADVQPLPSVVMSSRSTFTALATSTIRMTEPFAGSIRWSRAGSPPSVCVHISPFTRTDPLASFNMMFHGTRTDGENKCAESVRGNTVGGTMVRIKAQDGNEDRRVQIRTCPFGRHRPPMSPGATIIEPSGLCTVTGQPYCVRVLRLYFRAKCERRSRPHTTRSPSGASCLPWPWWPASC